MVCGLMVWFVGGLFVVWVFACCVLVCGCLVVWLGGLDLVVDCFFCFFISL